MSRCQDVPLSKAMKEWHWQDKAYQIEGFDSDRKDGQVSLIGSKSEQKFRNRINLFPHAF
jgi:hypothetical protein